MTQVEAVNNRRNLSDRLAVIDVGSNSVRMVVYPATALAAPPLFNEKAMCGLGRGQGPGGSLSKEAMDKAMDTLHRFAHLARAMEVGVIDAAATAAVRDAANGREFLDRIHRETGLSVRILDGDEEARLAARGVLAASPGARGLVGDLGGGSLELMHLDPDRPDGTGQGTSLGLGTLRLAAMELSGGALDRRIDDGLARVDWMPRVRNADLYIVGGAWRSLGRLEMARTRYPLHVLHGYTLPSSRVETMCRLFAGLSLESLRRIEAAPKDRLDTLALAARILGRLLHHSGAKRVIFSDHGLRDGILYENLTPEHRAVDPLLASCRLTALATARDDNNGLGHGHGDSRKLTAWLMPLFPNESEDDKRLRLAAALLSDIGWRIHPDERADHAMADVLRAPLIGLEHGQRIKLALAIRYRYTHRRDSHWVKPYEQLIPDEDRLWSRRVGQALRLAHTLSGGIMGLLADYRLSRDDETMTLHGGADGTHMIGEAATKRLAALARSFGLGSRILAD
jgi:exopolyphosphatase/guanosine-5'-triphosphate,3'-diphosphate pyrophosphatase